MAARALRYLAPPLIWMAAIFVLGGEAGSAERTQGWLTSLLAWLGILAATPADGGTFLNFALRKVGHFLAYALLGGLVARGLRGLRPETGRGVHLAAWAIALLWAVVDEYHQSFTPSRGASAADVFLDGAGAAVGVWVYEAWRTRSRRRRG